MYLANITLEKVRTDGAAWKAAMEIYSEQNDRGRPVCIFTAVLVSKSVLCRTYSRTVRPALDYAL